METLLFLASEAREFSGLLPYAGGVRELSWGLDFVRAAAIRGRRCLLVANGPGPRLASLAVEEALSRERVGALVSAGYCGALDPELRAGEVLTATWIVDADAGGSFAATPAKAGKPVRFACCDRVVETAAEKRTLRSRTGADAVDMESAAVARIAHREGLPCYALRVVSDTADENFRNDFNAARDASGRFSKSAILLGALRRPLSRVPELFRLARTGREAARVLGGTLGACDF